MFVFYFSAIFLWLCSSDLTQLNFSKVDRGSPEEILMNLQRGHTTYAVVYETLCRYNVCSIIIGILVTVLFYGYTIIVNSIIIDFIKTKMLIANTLVPVIQKCI